MISASCASDSSRNSELRGHDALLHVFSRGGTTPAAFIRGVRLEEAARLLSSHHHRDVLLFEVALRLGFANATTSTRTFKQVHGLVPSEYRAAVANVDR
ncbi:helix-turn-helix domain-containing protein [Arthrobacter sp. NyZ413]|uniref:helix-turn-helix domain-containing protein n=1 Tax=Arthrobacter sp. NyZ413 TaxID=3144669 RepID=UPI003BF8C0BA